MKINYITSNSWWDTDKTIIPSLSKMADLKVFCLNHSYGFNKEPHKKVPANVILVELNQKYRNNDPRSIWYALKFFYLSYLKNRDDETVYFLTPSTNLWLYLLFVIFLPKSRTIISSHNYHEHEDIIGLSSSIKKRIKRKAYRRFRYFHFYSNTQFLLFKNDYPYKKAFFTLMPPKDYGPLSQVEKKHSEIHLLFFGLIRAYKRLDWLIEAVKEVNVPNIKVVIAGKVLQEDERKYLDMIGEDVTFETHFGFVKSEEIPQYFSDADFLVLPYRSATQSGPSLIAINYGVPIIASDVPTFRELIIEGKTGFLFRNDSLDSLKEILIKVSCMSRQEIDVLKKGQKDFKEEYIRKNNIGQQFSHFIRKNISYDSEKI